ncbi:DUF6415 family natural product biosynthesis protein [Streptomyces sp. NPDC020965]|uniref:DUF6415 family natural product biosynthesis protein n=1 Tax=Streptomyces sp. NPDC020965 TaxID=3365105 RepID=UPI0037A38D5A
MNRYGSVVHDPTAILHTGIRLDRAPHEHLADAVLDWRQSDTTTPPPLDIEQITLQLTCYARLLTDQVRSAYSRLPHSHLAAVLGRITSAEATRQLSVHRSLTGPLAHAQSRARLVQALHRALDRADAARNAAARPTP